MAGHSATRRSVREESMKHLVLRSFPAGEREAQPGEVIDTASWRERNVQCLVRQRFLKELLLTEEIRESKPAKSQRHVDKE